MTIFFAFSIFSHEDLRGAVICFSVSYISSKFDVWSHRAARTVYDLSAIQTAWSNKGIDYVKTSAQYTLPHQLIKGKIQHTTFIYDRLKTTDYQSPLTYSDAHHQAHIL